MRDHPRACGAHPMGASTMTSIRGSSPRMRGSLLDGRQLEGRRGIIPAHAGLTLHRLQCGIYLWDHPRACGAHTMVWENLNGGEGSSPRMRGSPLIFWSRHQSFRIIPAHAGLTWYAHGWRPHLGDHPRACGAHTFSCASFIAALGSSPRMRGSRLRHTTAVDDNGIIPAHAGLTQPTPHGIRGCGDHPRACGAHMTKLAEIGMRAGSSPRMRGSHVYRRTPHIAPGIIPAHAGLTARAIRVPYPVRDHPRACGAHFAFPLLLNHS